MPIHNVYKPLGWSPLDAVHELQQHCPELINTPITYAGRLDPMAEGVLLLLSGEDRFLKPTLQKLPKTYKATFLFGLTSDTYDGLGLVATKSTNTDINANNIASIPLGIGYSRIFIGFPSKKLKTPPPAIAVTIISKALRISS